MEYVHTLDELKELQALPLPDKIALSKLRIVEWYEHHNGKVCVSYSGGKDSTDLLKLVRELYPEVPAVYVDTRLDYPEVREHVKATENVIWLKPDMNFREVIEKYGYCYPYKEAANVIYCARKGAHWANNYFQGLNADGSESPFKRRFIKWHWLLDLPYKISDQCCDVMKENPMKRFHKQNGLAPYVGLMTAESWRRQRAWLRTGCNSFSTGMSKPLSVWNEQDILRYIVENGVKIPSVFGEITEDEKGKLKTTGEKRTGCIFCPIGAHLDKPNRFERMKETHPALYRYCMTELGLDEFLTAVGVPH